MTKKEMKIILIELLKKAGMSNGVVRGLPSFLETKEQLEEMIDFLMEEGEKTETEVVLKMRGIIGV